MEKTIKSTLLHKGRHFNFKIDEVELPHGRITTRDIVEHPGAVAIIPIIGNDLLLVRQYRYAANETLLEIPAGTMEINEEPLTCAIRELQEETGYAANKWDSLFSCYMAPGYSNEIIYFFVASDLIKVGKNLDEDEDISVESYSFAEVLKMIYSNEIRDAKTISGVLRYLTRTIPQFTIDSE
jgi:ADP-ribose pyrophosphatase